jgi:hypothetical protein
MRRKHQIVHGRVEADNGAETNSDCVVEDVHQVPTGIVARKDPVEPSTNLGVVPPEFASPDQRAHRHQCRRFVNELSGRVSEHNLAELSLSRVAESRQNKSAKLEPLHPAWQGINPCRIDSYGSEEVFCDLDGIGESADEAHIGAGPFSPRLALPPEPEQVGALERLLRKRRAVGVSEQRM